MHILLSGGTGFIGNKLIAALAGAGHSVTVLTRKPMTSNNRFINYQLWDGKEMPLAVRVAVFDGVINLAGASIADKAWTEAYKQSLLGSRLAPTQACVRYIQQCNLKPKFFLNASAIGYYGGNCEVETDENAAAGSDFMAQLCRQWEEAAAGAGVRTVIARIGVVLGKGGGMIAQIAPLYKYHIGGRLGNGKQGLSWIHLDDLLSAILFCMENEQLEGVVNMVAPKWLPQAEFSKAMDKAMHKWNPFFVPKFALNLILGERAIIVWGGQKVVPARLAQAQFTYRYPEIGLALKEIFG